MFNRLVRHWVYGGALAGLLLLALFPLLTASLSAPSAAVFLCLIAYMLHQLEEHDDDRFRLFLNRNLGQGRDILSPAAIFVINVPGVWGVIAISLWLCTAAGPGFGLIAVYLLLVNAAVHVIPAVVFRRYNPGLVTAVILFIPVGVHALLVIQRAGGGTAGMHALGAAVAVLIHAAIAGYVQRARRAGGTRASSCTCP